MNDHHSRSSSGPQHTGSPRDEFLLRLGVNGHDASLAIHGSQGTVMNMKRHVFLQSCSILLSKQRNIGNRLQGTGNRKQKSSRESTPKTTNKRKGNSSCF